MARKQDMMDGSNNRRGGLLKFIIMHPTLIGFLALIILGVILYTIQAVSGEANDIMKMYDIIGNVKTNSKADFDKRLFFITINTDGTKSVTVGFRSDIEKELAERAASEAGTGMGNFDDTAISTELDKFITEMRAKESTVTKGSATVGYFVMNLSNDLKFAAGVMGNSSGEGTLGQWQIISSLTNLQLSKGKYSPVYSGKTSTSMSTTCKELYNDLQAVSKHNRTRPSGVSAIGWGPTQATYYTNIDKYVKAMESLKYSDKNTIVNDGVLKAMESAYVNATFNKKSIQNYNTSYMNGMKYTSEKVYEEVYKKLQSGSYRELKIAVDAMGVTDSKLVVKWTYDVFVNYERPSDYHTVAEGLPNCTNRAINALKAYVALREVKDGK